MNTPRELAGAGAPVSAIDAPSRGRSLWGDQQGAIMVLGIFMCSVIVGVLWYLAGIGDAVVYRERVQEASDAVAFSGATLHARGMNLIVLINLLMACVLAVRVILKAIVLALRIVYAILQVICLIPIFGTWACVPAPLVNVAANAVQTALNEIDPIIDEVLVALHQLEVVIKTIVPPAALPGSWQVGEKYKPTITEGAGVALGEVASGLPVEDGSLDMLCGKAGEAVSTVIEWPLKKVGIEAAADILGSITEKIVKAGGAYFCGFGGGSPPNLDDIMNDQVNDMCGQEKDGFQEDYQQARNNWHGGFTNPETNKHYKGCNEVNPAAQCTDPFPGGFGGVDEPQMTFDETKVPAADAADLQFLFQDVTTKYNKWRDWNKDQCKNQKKAKLKEAEQAGQTSNTSNSGNKTPMKVKEDWKNGVPNAQFLSLVQGDAKRILKMGARGVKVGAFRDRRQATPAEPESAKWGFAQAEFFYDCVGAWAADGCNHGPNDSKEEAMWHFKWRARLRRYSAPNDAANVAIGAALVDLANNGRRFSLIPSNLDPNNIALRGEVFGLATRVTDPKSIVFH